MPTYAIILLIITISVLIIWKTWNKLQDDKNHRLSNPGIYFIIYITYSTIIAILIALFWRNDVFLKLSSFLFWIPMPIFMILKNKYDKK